MDLGRPLSSPGSTYKGTESVLSANDDPVDYVTNPDQYFSDLSALHKHAQKTLQKEEEEEAKLVNFLPLVERANLNKEGKVLTRWQERQKEWERVQSVVSKKISSKVARPLMMATTDEYRARMEEYDLIQAAIPFKERHSNSAWEMSLRGGGPISIPVGHIFSGLECEIDPVLPKPKIVRKPKDLRATFNTDTFVPKTDAYQTRRKELLKTITEMRPRDITFKDAGALVIQAVDLFQWAKDSSQEVIDNLLGEQSLLLASDESKQHVRSEDEADEHPNRIPRVEFQAAREIIFETTAGVESCREIPLKNISETTIYYRFEPVHPAVLENECTAQQASKAKPPAGATAEAAPTADSLSKVLDRKGRADDETRARTLAQQRDSFFCLQRCGELLPQETVAVPFTFRDSAGGGYYSSTWCLRVWPEQTKVFYHAPVPDATSTTVGGLRVHMVGHCLLPDEHAYKRAELSAQISLGQLNSFMRDLVMDCVQRVRLPVRQAVLCQREITTFQRINAAFLAEVLTVDGLVPPTFFTTERLRAVDQVHEDVRALARRLREQYEATLSEHNELAGRAAHAVALPFDAGTEWQAGPSLRPALLPEGSLDIFDEVTEDAVNPTWDWDLARLHARAASLVPAAEHLRQLTEAIAKMREALDKARRKEERRAARKAAGESDDEDEEEDQDEEEEEEDSAAERRVKLHPLELEAAAAKARVTAQAMLLTTSPLDVPRLESLAAQMWGDVVVGQLEDAHGKALQTSGLADFVARSVPIPTLPSPFTSVDGAEAWQRALQTTSPVPDAPTDKKAAKAPKNAPPPSAPTQQQVDFFYKEMYESVRAVVLEACEGLFEQSAAAYLDGVAHTHAGHPLAGKDAAQVAVPRSVDVADKFIFWTIDGDLLATDASARSTFPLQQLARQQLVASMVELLVHEPKAVVLVAESASTQTAPASLAMQVEAIRSSLRESWAAHLVRDRRARRKLKQPVREYREPDLRFARSFADLMVQMDHLLRCGGSADPSAGPAAATEYFRRSFPVFVLENLAVAGVVPPEPGYVSEDSDEDEAPVYVGREQAQDYKHRKWIARRPFHVPVPIPGLRVTRDCYCETYAALREALAVAQSQDDEVLWVDNHARGVFDPASTFHDGRVCEDLAGKRMVGPATRETLGWCAVVKALRRFPELRDQPEEQRGPLATQLAALFPQCASERRPTSVLVLGGELRPDKLRLLDEMVAMVDSVVVVGELALPFVALNPSVRLLRHQEACAQYAAACRAVLRKARVAGCALTWPDDLQMGEEALSAEQRMGLNNVDAKTDGTEYEAEVKVFSVRTDLDAPELVLSGWAYDIGPRTVTALKETVTAADLVLVWGTCGVTQSSAFQAGTQALADSLGALSKASVAAHVANTPDRVRRHSLVVGRDSAEWFRRFLDGDGDLEGDLVGGGLLSFLDGDSFVISSVLGQRYSTPLATATAFRDALPDEWVFAKLRRDDEEEEDEEEDEEEEEEDDA